jgi:hypothetical protein
VIDHPCLGCFACVCGEGFAFAICVSLCRSHFSGVGSSTIPPGQACYLATHVVSFAFVCPYSGGSSSICVSGNVHQLGASCFLGSVCIEPRDRRVPCIPEAFTSLYGDLFWCFWACLLFASHEAKVNWASNKVAVK